MIVKGLLCAVGALGLTGLAASSGVAARSAENRTGVYRPVVVELFTSEGCSSCPPADAVLAQLNVEQPITGVQIIGFEEHVDYWDRLGWRDPFSSAASSARQAEYQRTVFRTGTVYTPQAVINGRIEALGSDRSALSAAVRKVAQEAVPTLRVAAVRRGSSLLVSVQADGRECATPAEPCDVVVVVTEDHLVTHVQRGENGGRTLVHGAVLRQLATAGTVSAGDGGLSTDVSIKWDPAWQGANLHAVAFLQSRRGRQIVAAGVASALEGGAVDNTTAR